uniref:STAS domain-containing protein n=2 Tax=Clastoptera arizonana TaxID=38151 RepID=A0A1B6D6T1_9HEMI
MSNCDSGHSVRFQIDRPIYQLNSINEVFNEKRQSLQNGVAKIEQNNFSKYKKKAEAITVHSCTTCNPKKFILKTFPILVWLRTYSLKEDLIRDLLAGFTVAVMNIPQGMAYALLGNVPPVVGLYMAIFPAFFYTILGTSKHCAMGSFAVITLLSGKIVNKYATAEQPLSLNDTLQAATSLGTPTYTAVEVASAVCFLVGIYQLILYLLRLGSFASFLSDTIVNSLTAGAAVHVFTSQVRDLLGLKFKACAGNFQNVCIYIKVYQNFETINIATCVVSLISILLLVFNNEYLKPWVAKKTIIPVPIELFLLVIGTIAAQVFKVSEIFNMNIVGDIAIGLPPFQAPPAPLLPYILVDSFVVAIVTYVITISIAFMYAQKDNYEIDPNQELLAQGAGNLFGSFFSCLPFCASLSRSVIQYSVGGRTQITSIVSATILIGVLTSFADIFEPLPRAILASIIVVALRRLLYQVTDVVKVWKLSKLDGLVYIATYLTVVFIEVDKGLLVGIVLSNLVLCFKGVRPKVYKLARLPNTEMYVDALRYAKVERIDKVCIVRFGGSLNFTNQDYIKNELYKLVGINPKEETLLNTLTAKVAPVESQTDKLEFIVIDLSGVLFVDSPGAQGLQSFAREFSEISVQVLLAETPESVYDMFIKCKILNDNLFTLFPTLHDAVLYAEDRLSKSSQITKF